MSNKSTHKHPNAKIASINDHAFKAACVKADVPQTHRQWRKWQQKRGAAYAVKD